MPEFKNEREFLKAVKKEAVARGWKLHHETYSMGTVPGYPDLTLVHPEHGVRWLELKVKQTRSKTYPKQVEWRDALVEAGEFAAIVYPHHWDDIIRLLDGEDVTIHDNDAQKELTL